MHSKWNTEAIIWSERPTEMTTNMYDTFSKKCVVICLVNKKNIENLKQHTDLSQVLALLILSAIWVPRFVCTKCLLGQYTAVKAYGHL